MLSKLRYLQLQYGFLLSGLLLVNVGLINWYLWSTRQVDGQVVSDSRVSEGCDRDCVNELIQEEIERLPSPGVQLVEMVPTPTPTKTVAKSSQPTVAVSPRTSYVALADGTAGATLDWTSLDSSKWLDTALYGELVSATFEGWIEIPGGSGTARVRLFDATNGRAVDGSEVAVSNVVATSFYSGPISLWRGQNQYFIQVKSSGGGVVSISQARIKLVVQ